MIFLRNRKDKQTGVGVCVCVFRIFDFISYLRKVLIQINQEKKIETEIWAATKPLVRLEGNSWDFWDKSFPSTTTKSLGVYCNCSSKYSSTMRVSSMSIRSRIVLVLLLLYYSIFKVKNWLDYVDIVNTQFEMSLTNRKFLPWV